VSAETPSNHQAVASSAIASDRHPARDNATVSTELLLAGANLCITCTPADKCTPRARLLPRRSENRASTLTTSRTYVSVEDLDMELVNARVWIGFHYRNSVRAGENLGTNVYTRDDEGD